MLFNSKTYYQCSSICGYASSVCEMITFIQSLPIQERVKHSGSYLYSCLASRRIIGIVNVSGTSGKVTLRSFHQFKLRSNSYPA